MCKRPIESHLGDGLNSRAAVTPGNSDSGIRFTQSSPHPPRTCTLHLVNKKKKSWLSPGGKLAGEMVHSL